MHQERENGIARRDLLKGALAASMGSWAGSGAGALAAAAPTSEGSRLIARENAKPGALDWQLTAVRVGPGDAVVRCAEIEDYCSRQSVTAGESIQIMVSTDPPAQFIIEIFRMGYYGGRGARLMKVLGPFQGRPQPVPPVGPKRIRECRWDVAAEVTIPEDWVSGVYLGRLSRIPPDGVKDPWQSYVVFIVRDDRPADILFQCSDNTWQAYNRWPDYFSLYDDGITKGWSMPLGVDVSFDRPYGKYRQIYENPQSLGSGEFLCWEFPLAYWLEQDGYDVTYCSNSDMIAPDRGLKCKTFISVGHDEYWDLRQYDSVKKMIEEGVNALFLSGNAISGITPFRPSSDGRANRIIDRVGNYGGWHRRSKPRPGAILGPDEGLVMGSRNINPVNGGGDWICSKPEHWIFEGTGMKKGDRIRGLIGWEYHGDPADIPGLEVVADGIALSGGVRPSHWSAVVFPGPKGNFVFNAATIFWSMGLSSPPGHMLPWSHSFRPHGPDPRVQRITENLLKRKRPT